MIENIKLSALVEEVQQAIMDRFEGESYWISAQITNVKKYEGNRRCYLTLEEYDRGEKTAEVKAVFWSNYYDEIDRFEKATGQIFKNGIEIICRVKVRYHKVYGLNVDVVQIDFAHTLGSLELERQQTLERLLRENPNTIQLYDGLYRTYNNRLPLPLVVKRIALITAPNSDGQRDFMQEITKNRHGYKFEVKEFLTTVQGEQAHKLILEQLRAIEIDEWDFDAIAIVRGGGSQTDFKPFEDYELARNVANFDIPVFTGIGHDRNQSIVDLMAREQKTPTKVASLFVEHNFGFENKLMDLKTRLSDSITDQIQSASEKLSHAKRLVKMASPEGILNRGFAIVKINGEVITDPALIKENTEIQTILSDQMIYSIVTKKEYHGK